MLRRFGLSLVLLVALLGCSSQVTGPLPPTDAEYRAAKQAVVDCLIEAGYDAEMGKEELSDEYWVGMNNVDPDDQVAEAAYNRCDDEYAFDIELAWQAAQHLTGAERDRAMQDLVRCLDKVGVTGLIAGQSNSEVFVKVIDEQLGADPEAHFAAMTCMERYRGVWPKGDPNNP